LAGEVQALQHLATSAVAAEEQVAFVSALYRRYLLAPIP
jgi:hypothetical protein